VTDKRDVAAFDGRARSYEEGWLGRFHHEVADRTVAIAESVSSQPNRVLDVGCGTGYLLRCLADRHSSASAFVGVDASPAMIEVARSNSSDKRIEVREATAERLPFADGAFDLIVSTTSFDHWSDQAAGLRECARVLAPEGALVVADLFSPLLVTTLVRSRRNKARTRGRAERLIDGAGLQPDSWHRVHTLIQAFVARPCRAAG